MEDLIAVAVDFTEVGTRYFIVYGRIFGAVNYEAIEAVVLKAAQRSDYGGTAHRNGVQDPPRGVGPAVLLRGPL